MIMGRKLLGFGAWCFALLPALACAEGWESSLITSLRPADSGNGSVHHAPVVSADGRYAAFDSGATNILATQHDHNRGPDVFLHDRTTDTVILVSRVAGDGSRTADGGSLVHAISADGRYVAFQSNATNLVDGVTDTNLGFDVFLFDRTTGTNTLVSHAAGSPLAAANGAATDPLMTPDARFVAYASAATNVLAGVSDGNARVDLFLHDRTTGETVLVTGVAGSPGTTANDGSAPPTAITPDGRWLAFASRATDLVAGVTDANSRDDAFLFDRTTGTITLASRDAAGAATPSGVSLPAGVSDDGRWIVLNCSGTGLVAGVTDANGNGFDVYLFDRETATTTLVTRGATAGTTANGSSHTAGVSSDGRYVPINSTATDLVPGLTDGNGNGFDAYLHDRIDDTTVLLSSAAGTPMTTANGSSEIRAFASGGRYVVVKSFSTNLLPPPSSDANGTGDLFLFDTVASTRQLVSHTATSTVTTANGQATSPAISADGRFVAFIAGGNNLVAGVSDLGQSDAFSFDRDTGVIAWASRARGLDSATGDSVPAGISDDARWVLYSTTARDVLAGVNDSNGVSDVYLHDRTTGTPLLVSRSAAGATTTASGATTALALDASGRYALYSTSATNVLAGVTDTNSLADYYVFDRTTGTPTLVSRQSGTLTTLSGRADQVTMSADGNWVAFHTVANNVVTGVTDTNNRSDVFLFNRATGSTTLVSHAGGDPTTAANDASSVRALSADGRWLAYYSFSTNLVTGVTDSNNRSDAFVYDRATGTNTLISRSASSATTTANGGSDPAAISDDGTWVALTSFATNLVSPFSDDNSGADAFRCNRVTGACTLVSHAAVAPTQSGNGRAGAIALTPDGRWLAYTSAATNVLSGATDTNGTADLYLHDRDAGVQTLVSRQGASGTATADGAPTFRDMSADGRRVLYASTATNVVAAGAVDENGASDLFVFDRVASESSLVTRAWDAVLATADAGPTGGLISPDGQWVAYGSDASDAVRMDNNLASDVYVAGRRVVVYPVATEGGSLTPGVPVTVVPGESLALTVTAFANYALQDITGCGGTLSGDSYGIPIVNADCTVTATFVATAHTLEYAAGANGSLTGETSQVVAIGGTGTAVTAVPNEGWHFAQWSDGVLANPRTDSNVVANVDVIAQFANDAPVLGLEAARTVLEDSGTASVVFTVSDAESAAGSLVASANVAPSGVLGIVGVAAGASSGERVLSFTPVADAFGEATVTVTLTDPAGGSSSAPLAVTVTPVNDAPMLTLGSVGTHAAASTGARSVPGFAAFFAGPGGEDATQAVLDYEFMSLEDPDAILAVGSLDIVNDGTLSYTLTGRGGTANASVRVRDDGGTANGGADVSATQSFALSVLRSADLRVTKDNGTTTVSDGDTTVYTIVVENLGPNAVADALLADALPSSLVDATWACVPAASTASCPTSSGSGSFALSVSLAAGQHLRFDLMATVDAPIGAFVENTAVVLMPAGVEALNPGDDSATDRDEVVALVLFQDGFE